jgi:tape measure domain-containing protein
MANQIINVIVNSKGAVTVARELNAIGDSARQTTTYLNGLRAILASALTFSGVQQIVEVVDTFTTLQNRLKLVTDESNTLGDSWNRLMGIANSSYSTIDSTVTLYYRVAQAYKAWGESAAEAYEFTDLFQKSAILSGSSMQTTAQAVYQFGQALNKGKLDGDEFRSVLEGLPYVAQLIQKELGVTRAELYEMSANGEISLDRIKAAFENAAATIRGDWANVTPTIGMALNVLYNNWVNFIAEIQDSTGVFSYIAQAILLVANNLGVLMLALTPVAAAFAFLAGRLAIGLVVIGLRDMATALRLATAAQWLFNAAVLANPYVLAAAAIAAIVAGIIYFRNELGLTNEVLLMVWESIKSGLATVLNAVLSVSSPIVAVLRYFYTWEEIWNGIKAAAIAFGSAVVTVFNAIVSAVKETADFMSKTFYPVWVELKALAQNYFELIVEIATFINDVLNMAIEALGPTFQQVYDIMEPALKWVYQILGDIYRGWVNITNWLLSNLKPAIKDVFEGWAIILQTIIDLWNTIISAIRSAIALARQYAGMGGGSGAGGAHYGAQFNAGEGFATGGAFKVGGTGAGRDTTPVAFRAERGERVTVETKKQQRQNDNAPTAANVNVPVKVVNVFDPAMIVEAMSTAAGQKAILNTISGNRDEINFALGVS